MGSKIKRVRSLLGLTDAGLVWLAWRNRDRILDSARFAVDAVGRWREGHQDDVLAEARLRARILADPRARSARDVDVSVRGGVASVVGRATDRERSALVSAAERTKGVAKVRESVTVDGRRRFARR